MIKLLVKDSKLETRNSKLETRNWSAAPPRTRKRKEYGV